MLRIVVDWQGPQVEGNAVSVLYFDNSAQTIPSTVLSAFSELTTALPDGLVITVPQSGDIIDPDTGNLSGAWSESAGGGSISGHPGPASAAGVGGCVTWRTSTIRNARRVRGRTFLVPLQAGAYEADGTIVSQVLDEMDAFADTLSQGGLVVWSRPSGPAAADGLQAPVTGYTIRDKVAFLSSRRD